MGRGGGGEGWGRGMVAGSLSWQIAQIQVRKATVNKLKPKTVKSVKISCISRLSEKSQETGLFTAISAP